MRPSATETISVILGTGELSGGPSIPPTEWLLNAPYTFSPNLGLMLVFLSAPVSPTSLQITKEKESEKKTLKRKRDEEEERSLTKVCKEGFQLFHHHVFSSSIGEDIRQRGVQP